MPLAKRRVCMAYGIGTMRTGDPQKRRSDDSFPAFCWEPILVRGIHLGAQRRGSEEGGKR